MAQTAVSLDQLQTLHLPEDISQLPLTLGWLLTLVISLGLVFLIYKYTRNSIAKNAYRRAAIDKLADIFDLYQLDKNDRDLLIQINQLLKTIAMGRYPQELCAKMSGATWLIFLSSSSANIKNLDSSIFAEFSNIYRPNLSLSDSQCQQLFASTKLWLAKHHDIVAIQEHADV